MKSRVISLLVSAALFVLGSNAYGQHIGTYCSAKTADGFWSMRFGPLSANVYCDAVRADLRRVTTERISGSHHGFYNINGVNRVLTRCGFYYRNITTSVGGYALQNAVDTAANSRLDHCLFIVNSY